MESVRIEASPCANCVHVNSWPGEAPKADSSEHDVWHSRGRRLSQVFITHPLAKTEDRRGLWRARTIASVHPTEAVDKAFAGCPGPVGRHCGAIALLNRDEPIPEFHQVQDKQSDELVDQINELIADEESVRE